MKYRLCFSTTNMNALSVHNVQYTVYMTERYLCYLKSLCSPFSTCIPFNHKFFQPGHFTVPNSVDPNQNLASFKICILLWSTAVPHSLLFSAVIHLRYIKFCPVCLFPCAVLLHWAVVQFCPTTVKGQQCGAVSRLIWVNLILDFSEFYWDVPWLDTARAGSVVTLNHRHPACANLGAIRAL